MSAEPLQDALMTGPISSSEVRELTSKYTYGTWRIQRFQPDSTKSRVENRPSTCNYNSSRLRRT
jgi:hypothetical protein